MDLSVSLSRVGWDAFSSDPNSPQAHAYRDGQLRDARRSPVDSRAEYLATLVRGRRVLDVGCVDHLDPTRRTAPLHRKLAEAAGDLVGVDIQPQGVEDLRAEGYVVHLADVTVPGLYQAAGGAFDVVIAGEIIEHLIDISQFLQNVREVLKPDGCLVLTSPNPHSLFLIVLNLIGRNPDNVDHVVYHYPSGMAEIADRCGFRLAEVRGERSPMQGRRMQLLGALARGIAHRWPSSNADCISLIYTLCPK